MKTNQAFSLLLPYIKTLVWLLILNSLLRAIFYNLNLQSFQSLDSNDILLAFIHGIRFDLATISLCLAPWLLIVLPLYIFQLKKLYDLTTKLYWPLVPFVLIASNLADSLYFPFTGRRSGPEVISFTTDAADQGAQLITQYWPFLSLGVVLYILTTYMGYKLLLNQRSTLNTTSKKPTAWYSRLTLACFIFLFSAIAIRSTWHSKPLSPSHAFNWPSSDTGNLVLNSAFTLLKQDSDALKEISFFDSHSDAKQANLTQQSPYSTPEPNSNVVILVLESFASEYLDQSNGKKGYAPFLQSLARESIYFPKAYANGRRSIDALPSILAALPPLLNKPFISSNYVGNKISGIAQLLAEEGYQSHFFHGAKNGSMFIDTMSKRFGFDIFTGLNEYPYSDDYDGKWGVFDEPFLQHMASTLNTMEQPFVAGAFTLSSHNPYSLPIQYKDSFAKGTLAIHPTIGYTDLALKEFFASAEKMPWYNNTLFIITADHTSISDNTLYQTPLGRHQVPILLFNPSGKLSPVKSNKTAQHTDISSTILDYLGLQNKYKNKLLPFGNSLLGNGQGEAFFIETERYVLVTPKAKISASKDFQKVDFSLNHFIKNSSVNAIDSTNTNKSDEEILEKSMLKRLQAKVQIYNNGMLNNDFSGKH